MWERKRTKNICQAENFKIHFSYSLSRNAHSPLLKIYFGSCYCSSAKTHFKSTTWESVTTRYMCKVRGRTYHHTHSIAHKKTEGIAHKKTEGIYILDIDNRISIWDLQRNFWQRVRDPQFLFNSIFSIQIKQSQDSISDLNTKTHTWHLKDRHNWNLWLLITKNQQEI